MSQMEGTSNAKSSTIRTSWKDNDKVKFFLDCCVNEVARAGRLGTSLRKESWDRVAKQMKEKYNMELAQKQMKNQFDYLRTMYVEWSNLVNKNTGHGYNPVTKTMDWTLEKWDEYLKAHPKASAFRMSGFRWEEEGKALFEGVSAIVCCAIHNYLRREKVRDQLFECYEDPNICIPSSSSSQVDTEEAIQHLDIGESSTQNNQQFMIQLRDQIANTLMTRRGQTQR